MGAFTYQNDLLAFPLDLLAVLLAAGTAMLLRRLSVPAWSVIARGISDRTFWMILGIASATLSLIFSALSPLVLPWGGLDRYFVRALNLASYGVFGYGDMPTAWFPPGYSFILLPLAALFGDVRWAFFLTNLSLLIAFTLILRSSLRILGVHHRTANLLSSAIFLYPNRLFSTLLPFSDIPFSLISGGAFLAVIMRMQRVSGWRSALVIGLLGGCASLVRNNGLAMFPALLAGAVLSAGPDRRERWVHGLVMAAAFGLVLVPWLARNRQVTGQIVPVALNGGVNLAIGNNASGSVTFNTALDSVWTEERIHSVLGSPAVSEVRRDSLYRVLGTEYIMSHPVTFATRAFGKIGRTFAADNHSFSALCVYTNFMTVGASIGRSWGLPAWGTALLHALTGTTITVLIVVNSALYYLLIAWTFAAVWRRRRESAAWIWTFLLVVAGTGALVALTFGLSRFKEPVGIAMVLFGLAEALLRKGERRGITSTQAPHR
jgi:hypothetical protein